MKSKLITIIAALVMLVITASACAQQAATPTPSQTPKPTATAAPTPTQPPITTPAPTPTPKPTTPTTSPTPTVAPAPVALTLSITDPADMSVTDVSKITIKGKTTPDAVVSINGDFVEVDVSGNFSLAVTLEEGPNVFEITATDEDGNQVDNELVVSYSP